MRTIFLAFFAALIGGGTVWLFQGHSLAIVPKGMSYADLAAVLLAVAALVLGVLAVIIGFLAFWGYKKFAELAVFTAKNAAEQKVAAELTEGDSRKLIENVAKNVAVERVESELLDGNTRKSIDIKIADAISKALAQHALTGSELAESRLDEAERFRELDEDEGGE